MTLEELQYLGWIFSCDPYAYEFRLNAKKGVFVVSGCGETKAIAEAYCLKRINEDIKNGEIK